MKILGKRYQGNEKLKLDRYLLNISTKCSKIYQYFMHWAETIPKEGNISCSGSEIGLSEVSDFDKRILYKRQYVFWQIQGKAVQLNRQKKLSEWIPEIRVFQLLVITPPLIKTPPALTTISLSFVHPRYQVPIDLLLCFWHKNPICFLWIIYYCNFCVVAGP